MTNDELAAGNAHLLNIIRDLLAIFDSEELKVTVSMAHIHGYQVAPEVAERNRAAIVRAKQALDPGWNEGGHEHLEGGA